jgi:hypothetical protein
MKTDTARGVRYLVVDDSPHAERDAESRALARAFATASRGAVHYLGHHEREDALAHVFEGFDGAQRVALLPMLSPHHPSAVTGSRTWNWAVLARRAARSPSSTTMSRSRCAYRPRRAPRGTCAQDSRPARAISMMTDIGTSRRWRRSRTPGSRASWERHLAHCWRGTASTPRRAAGFRPRRCTRLGRTYPCSAPCPGIYGAIPFDSSAYLTATDAQSNADLWREPFRVERLEADRIWNGVAAPRLVPEAVYTPLLLDARELLPFAGTWGRVDDQYFLMLLRAIASPVYFALVPALLGHEDPAPRDRRRRARQRCCSTATPGSRRCSATPPPASPAPIAPRASPSSAPTAPHSRASATPSSSDASWRGAD